MSGAAVLIHVTRAVSSCHGAQDYLIKGQHETALLPRAVTYAIERKRVQCALQSSESRFRRIIEQNADPIIIIDAMAGSVWLKCGPWRWSGKKKKPEANKDRAMKAGAFAFFQKPADYDALLAAIEKALEV